MRSLNALIIVCLISTGCARGVTPRFAEAAELVCNGLEDFDQLKHAIVSVHLLMDRGDYSEALKASYGLLSSLNENQDVDGANELRALIFLLESIVKGQ
jgi:hypothetical protein